MHVTSWGICTEGVELALCHLMLFSSFALSFHPPQVDTSEDQLDLVFSAFHFEHFISQPLKSSVQIIEAKWNCLELVAPKPPGILTLPGREDTILGIKSREFCYNNHNCTAVNDVGSLLLTLDFWGIILSSWWIQLCQINPKQGQWNV